MLPQLLKSRPPKLSHKTVIERLIQRCSRPFGLPEFPQFKPVELSDRAAIEAITNKYPPYSDFNFTSMWSWDVKGEMRVSQLNGNLVVRFSDYTTGKPFYSFLGDNKVQETAEKLLALSVKEGMEPVLKLLPEVSISGIDHTAFTIEEDRDHFDYIYPVGKLKTYDGNKLRSKRNLFNRFKKLYRHSIVQLDASDPKIQKDIMSLFDKWVKNKKSNAEKASKERGAFRRILQISKQKDLIFLGLFIDGTFAGIIVNEILSNNYATLHFEKADEKYTGIYACLMLENAKMLFNMGKKDLNYEQDLGIKGLRLGKKSFRPTSFLKKYVLTKLTIYNRLASRLLLYA